MAGPRGHFRHERSSSAGQAKAQLRAWLEAQAGSPVRVLLGGALCQPFVLPAIEGAANEDELRRAAAALAGQVTTVGPNCDVWVGPAPARGARIAAAVPAGLVSELVDGLKDVARVSTIRPWWAEALRGALKHCGPSPLFLGIDEGESLTLLGGSDGDFDEASGIGPLGDATSARAAWTRAMVVSDKPAERAHRIVLDFTGPEGNDDHGCPFGRFMRIERS